MGSDEEKKEVIVQAPSKSVLSEQKKTEKAAVKELEEERFNVLSISKKVGQYFGLCSICAGILLFAALAYAEITNQGAEFLLSTNTSWIVLGLWVTSGLISIFVGFLLIGSE